MIVVIMMMLDSVNTTPERNACNPPAVTAVTAVAKIDILVIYIHLYIYIYIYKKVNYGVLM
jgi:hypothetical protein